MVKVEDGDTKKMAQDVDYSHLNRMRNGIPLKVWQRSIFIDPCKFQLITPGINVETVNTKISVFMPIFLQTTCVKTESFLKNVT